MKQPSEITNEPEQIGKIVNYYGNLYVVHQDKKYYWSIECYNGHLWEEIPEYLYNSLIKFENENNARI
jgi:hypothetical protein